MAVNVLSEKCVAVNEKVGFSVYIQIMILITLLTACSTVLLEKLTGSQPVKVFPAFHGNRRFITALTRARGALGQCEPFVTRLFFRLGVVSTSSTSKLKDHPYRLSETAYSIYSQLPSICEAVPPSATGGRAIPW